MLRIVVALAITGVAAMPGLAMEQGAVNQAAQKQSTVQAPTQQGELSLYENVNYTGADYVIDQSRAVVRTMWNIRSVGIHPGDRWQICARPRFREPCIILDRSVHDATLIGVTGQIGSARPAPAPTPVAPSQGN